MSDSLCTAVHCPLCNANAGTLCFTRSGNVRRTPHAARTQLWADLCADQRIAVLGGAP